eukprot:CAMPEP_0115278750 /NCGR_PEP_ID=MMETSP0270-20121206/57913_1 /TAXON_ID=71861 /ORGANISM="Scrippsiella trochoidea, Strain CCMP3099" /LENGTH=160 /DNA_ID=CAMNT_0002695425 /DNA_START=103 /DNA_END=582 /DNA_ORIENTATION=+
MQSASPNAALNLREGLNSNQNPSLMHLCEYVEQPNGRQQLYCNGTQSPPKPAHVLVLLTDWYAATSSPAAPLSVADFARNSLLDTACEACPLLLAGPEPEAAARSKAMVATTATTSVNAWLQFKARTIESAEKQRRLNPSGLKRAWATCCFWAKMATDLE